MARFIDAIDLPVPVEQAFSYVADFSHTAEWDPGVVSAERLDSGALGCGSRFRVVVSFLGRELPLEYEITHYAFPERVVLVGGDDSVRSVDEITFVARPGGTRVTYEARLDLRGVRRIADPLVDLWFQRVGRLAVCGLRERVAQLPAQSPAGRVRRTPARPARRAEKIMEVRNA